MPHGATVPGERYTTGFPVCYGSRSNIFAVSSSFEQLYALCFKGILKKSGGGGGKGNCTQAGKCIAV